MLVGGEAIPTALKRELKRDACGRADPYPSQVAYNPLKPLQSKSATHALGRFQASESLPAVWQPRLPGQPALNHSDPTWCCSVSPRARVGRLFSCLAA